MNDEELRADLSNEQRTQTAYWLNRIDENWQLLDLDGPPGRIQGAFRCVYAGCAEMRCHVTYWLRNIGTGRIDRTEDVEIRFCGWWDSSDMIRGAIQTFGPSPIGFEWTAQLQLDHAFIRIAADFVRAHSAWRSASEERRQEMIDDLKNLAIDRFNKKRPPEMIVRRIESAQLDIAGGGRRRNSGGFTNRALWKLNFRKFSDARWRLGTARSSCLRPRFPVHYHSATRT